MADTDLIEARAQRSGAWWPGERIAGAASAANPGVYRTDLKRVFDIFFALMILPFVGLVVAVLTLVARRDGGPGLFGHTRIGQGGAPFRCWKIRTMVLDAESRLAAHLQANPAAAAEWAAEFKLRDDPRITGIGAFLRKTSLDELPQLYNVLRGEMSFVGPRPVTQDELARYGAAAKSYQSVRPGITGLWQVSGRNDVSYAERVELDRSYVANISFWGDTKIILKTAHSVLKSTGI